MSTFKHFLYEHRSKAIPKVDWSKIRVAAEKLLYQVDPTSGIPGSSTQIVELRNDDEALEYQLGSQVVSIKRVWKKKHYDAPELPSTLNIDALSDLFIRSVYLAVAFHAPAITRLELRTTGCVDGWKEARDLFEHVTGNLIDIDLMVADEKLCKGFDTPLPISGDFHLVGLAESVIGDPAAADMGDPDVSGSDGTPAPVGDIPLVSHSWFF